MPQKFQSSSANISSSENLKIRWKKEEEPFSCSEQALLAVVLRIAITLHSCVTKQRQFTRAVVFAPN